MSRLTSFWPVFVLNGLALIVLWSWTERYGEYHWLATTLAYIPQHLYGIPSVLLLIWTIRGRTILGTGANLIVMTVFLLTFMGFNIIPTLVQRLIRRCSVLQKSIWRYAPIVRI